MPDFIPDFLSLPPPPIFHSPAGVLTGESVATLRCQETRTISVE